MINGESAFQQRGFTFRLRQCPGNVKRYACVSVSFESMVDGEREGELEFCAHAGVAAGADAFGVGEVPVGGREVERRYGLTASGEVVAICCSEEVYKRRVSGLPHLNRGLAEGDIGRPCKL